MITASYHNHTWRCHHASGTEREYIEAAIAGGLEVIGFADHNPYIFGNGHRSGHRMSPEETGEYFNTLAALREEYRGKIDIKIGFEVEYYPAVFHTLLDLMKPYDFDYLIMGQHSMNNEYDSPHHAFKETDNESVLELYVNQVLEGLSTGKFSYMAHPDGMNYVGDRQIHKREFTRLCEGCKAMGIPLEVNLRGLLEGRHYPSEAFFRIAAEVGCEVVIGCDAHEIENVADPARIKLCEDFCQKLGIKPISRVHLRKPL
jgi:histidinol-phosphatase (PHP family)